jgi:hypothetical protein
MVPVEAMSEFKFACPVCGQHIMANSDSGGQQLECPTCFQKIVVPQAPESSESKLILSASQVAKARPATTVTGPVIAPARVSPLWRVLMMVVLLMLLAGDFATAWVFRVPPEPPRPIRHPRPKVLAPKPAAPFPIPTNILWSLDLNRLAFPGGPASGHLYGKGFSPEQTLIQGGFLLFRQGTRWRPELTLGFGLPVRQNEDLSGRSFEFDTNQNSLVTRIFLRCKDEQPEPRKDDFRRGYALKVSFGQATNGMLPGRIYVCLPDASKSVMAGTFEAEIKHPPPPKPQPIQASQAAKPH